ncbi:hypothetical protein D3C81_1786070 [compost metagenome]
MSQIRGSLVCARADGTVSRSRNKVASTQSSQPPRDGQHPIAPAGRRLRSDGSVFAQLCDLRRVIAKFLEYLCVVLTQLWPDPFTFPGCL